MAEITTSLISILYNNYSVCPLPIKEVTSPKSVRKGLLFKLCRVHNKVDLQNAICNGVNMIGIHAVYNDRAKYEAYEKQYSPKLNGDFVKDDLPLATLEIDSIRYMQSIIPPDMKQAIVFEREVSIDVIKDCCDIYNLKSENVFIQLQHRIDKKYLTKIKEKITKNIIVAIGLYQKDFKDYFAYLDSILDSESHIILLDMSKHQPDLIVSNNNEYQKLDNLSVFKEIIPYINNNRTPILLAGDALPTQLNNYIELIEGSNILFLGIDMQNIVEIPKNEQHYQIIEDKSNKYQIKIRKSQQELSNWNLFVKSQNSFLRHQFNLLKQQKIIVLDLDGTLLKNDKTISKYTIDILKLYKLMGNILVFATARPPRDAKKYIPQEFEKDILISYNGAVILENNRILGKQTIDVQTAKEILEVAIKYNHSRIAFEIDDKLYANFDALNVYGWNYELVELNSILNLNIAKIVVCASSNISEDFIARLPSNCNVVVTDSGSLLQIMAKNVSKWDAIKTILESHAELKSFDIIAFGDDNNDLEMVENATIGIAMGNAVWQLKQVSDAIIDSNEKDGVAQYLNNMLVSSK